MSGSNHWTLREGVSLGIDAGGTYTDAVLYDFAKRKVIAAAKSPTTRHDYAIGISQALELLPADDLKQARLVGLSTTLATNALVEDRGGKVGLILAGMQNTNLAKLEFDLVRYVEGSIDITGRETAPLDVSAARTAITELIEQEKVESIVLGGISSIRNPFHELKLRDLVREISDIPTVCGHELSQKLGAVERANTAACNARLLPLINRLINSVQNVLKNWFEKIPLYIVKGDGSLENWRMALEKPIETVASGPAASAVGARTLLGADRDLLVVDVGGTTTDIALLKHGQIEMKPTGARVGGHYLAIPGLDLVTAGLGGDSRIVIKPNHRTGKPALVAIGPKRVIPISLLASTYPKVQRKLEQFRSAPASIGINHQPGDFLVLIREKSEVELSGNQRRLVDILEKEGPLHLTEATAKTGIVESLLLGWEGLVQNGIAALAGLTPTDIWHAQGELDLWDATAAETALQLYGRRYVQGEQVLIEDVLLQINRSLCVHLLSKALGEGADADDTAAFARRLVREASRDDGSLQLRPRLLTTLVGLGAPARYFIPPLRDIIDTEVEIPRYGHVANAIGAASARVELRSSALIKNDGEDRISVHTQKGRAEFDSLEEAKDYARSELRSQLEVIAKRAGAAEYDIELDENDVFIETDAEQCDIFFRCEIEGRIVGLPSLNT
jgi:N-methylhydantoinase A/oxoprolinase/acetone carboxylase beta subunit